MLAVFMILAGAPPAPADSAKSGPGASLTPADADSANPALVRHKDDTWRALLEDFVFLTSSTIDYWGTIYRHYTVDWQFTWKTFGRKFFTDESPRLDSNAFYYNWTHTFSGAAYYNMARTNGLSFLASTLFSFGTSFCWESLSEWRELISINDILFTSFGGPAIGEALFQISSYFSHRKGLLNRAASFLFDPALAANNLFDSASGPDWDGGPDAGWHRFSLYAGLREDQVSPAGTTAMDHSSAAFRQWDFGLDMETDTVPGCGQPNIGRQSLSRTFSSRFLLDMSFSSAGLDELQIRTSAVLFGTNWQSVIQDQDGTLRGSDVSLGYGTAFELFKKRAVAWYDSTNEVVTGGLATSGDARFDRPTPTRFTDKLSVISPLGAVLVFSRFGPRLHVRWTSGVYGDFAMVNALAYNKFTEDHDTTGIKTTLLSWGYYYALGMTMASDVAVDWRQWRFQAGGSYEWFDSIQGLDRYQYMGLITDDFNIYDTRMVCRFKLGYRLRGAPVELAFAAEGIDRHGRILDVRDHYWENRVFYQIRLLF
ncbi:MAG: DUF3943 domain-containing protein [Candidatus Aminicenantales bacterium]